ncbi:amino acid adenylation domain-containing protein [Streptomyces alkaliphilus]|uniref:Phenyloxazoline synthase MbtB n=1 Tax=Streptomyces alkaliphilus TaxID=1472722 RepID=A0A7W3T989_9ACTN|nr:non-ribosomal peptide synthetase [Streptomyces alkaliphilus]MBB0242572.1 amino acid adenylation domain-containing protein [Streptomyces alkaliphilus]
MTATELISELKALGVDLWAESGQLRFRAPRGVLTEERRAALREHKATILELLDERNATRTVTADPGARHEPFPLTDVQTAYLLGRHDPFAYGGVACHGYLEVTYPRLDPDTLEDAWNRLVARHDMLRAVIEPDGLQRVLPEVPGLTVRCVDLRGAEPAAVETHFESVRAELGHRLYDTTTWPLFEVRLTRTDDGDVLHISLDALIADWASAGILLDELDVILDGGELPELTVRFRDYLLAERGLRDGARHRRDRDHWLARVDELPPAPELPMPTGRSEASVPARFERHHFRLSAERWLRLCERARGHGLTAATTVLTAYALVLERWSRQPRFTLNLTLLNRLPLHPEVDRLIGDFTSVNLLAVEGGADTAFHERAAAIGTRLFADLDHRLYSGVEVIREIARRRGREAALMPVVFTGAIGLGPGGTAGADRAPRRRTGYGITQTPQVLIDCQVTDDADGLEVNWDVRQGMLPEGLVEDMFAAMGALLGRLADSDEAWLDPRPVGLPDWQAEERRRVNDTARPLPEGLLHEAVLRRAERTPDAPAVITPAGTLTYGELLRRANGVAAALLSASPPVGPSERVAVVMDKGADQVVAVLGTLLAGAAYLPVDTTQPALRRNKVLLDAGVRHVLTRSRLAEREGWPDGPRVIAVDRVEPADHRPVVVPDDSLAYLIYTSGSTGDPKGVMITHRAALNTVVDVNERFGVTEGDRVLGVAQLGFDLSVYDIFGPLSAGGALVLPASDRRSDPSHWAELIAAHKVTVWNTVPAQLRMLADYLASESGDVGSLRLALLSGDWIPVTLPDRIRNLVPGLRVIGLGGATEAAIWSIHHPVERVEPGAASIPYGTPLANQGFRVLDHAWRDAPVWVPGELYITGAGLAEGYWGDGELTAARFLHHPVDGQRLYRTGDRGRYLPGGAIEFLGREDNQVKIRGHRVELGEIEAALLAHPKAAAAAVVASGEGREDRVLLGFVQPSEADPGQALPPEALDRITTAARAAADRETSTLDTSGVTDHVRRLHDAALAAMLGALCRRGLFTADDREHTAEEVLAVARVHERHHWLVRRWLTALTEHGWLRHDPASDRYARLRATDDEEVAAAWRRVAELGVPAGFCTREFVAYHEKHVERLDALLDGEQDPFELLFPEGRTDVALALYADDSIARHLNQGAAALLNRVAASRAEGSRLRILETGAGTGAMTSRIVPLLEGYDVDYHFTDVSAFFLAAARESFGDRPRMRFGRFDLDGDPRAQGLAPCSYDVVVCSGMLNSVRDPRAALATVAGLLDGDGWLVFTEPTGEHPHLLLTQGFMMEPEGGDRARGHSKLLTRERWTTLVEEVGGEPVLSLPDDDHPMAAQGMHLFAARFKTGRARVSGEELGAFLAERLPTHMVPARLQVVDALPVTANGKIDRRTLSGWRLAAPETHDTATDTAEAGDLEGRLGRLWASALGLPRPVGPGDNFFDLGADSLVLARVAGRLREEVEEAADVPFDTLLRQMLNEPTVAALAASLRSGTGEAAGEPTAEAAPAGGTGVGGLLGRRAARSNALIIPFGGDGAGDGRPARVLFHAALGTMDYFRSLARELVAQDLGPVLGLAVADPEEYVAVEPRDLIARIADDYTERLLAEGHTRFQLIGYCLGGLTATEVARRMLERGVEEVDLTLVDSIPMLVDTDEELALEAVFVPNLDLDPAEVVFGGEVDSADIYRAFELLTRRHGGRVPAGAMAELSGDPGLEAVAAAVREQSAISPDERLARYARHSAGRAGVPVGPELIPALYRVFRHSVLAAHIEPEPYFGDMTFLRAVEEQSFGITAGVGHLAQKFWEKTCVGRFDVIDVPGNHFSVIEPPQVTEVARHIGARIDGGQRS